ncbi:MAG TPA: hypothetical protein VFO77_11255 [Actinoplanes sp.]|nr:hypothetical protein [Actinoplanes sp.]
MRGGLDDALQRMARRDELRRRAEEQATGTPAAVTELVEAVAAVVARNPQLAITMGVEGVGDPAVLTFAMGDGIVQVSSDSPLSAQVASPPPADLDHREPVLEPDEIYPADSYRRFAAAAAPMPPVPPQSRGEAQEAAQWMPPPAPTPMPQVAEPEETEQAAKRLAAMLREDPSLLEPPPAD